jgi:hypothetical protein
VRKAAMLLMSSYGRCIRRGCGDDDDDALS